MTIHAPPLSERTDYRRKEIFPDELTLKDVGMRGDSRIFKLAHFFRVATSLGIVTIPTGFETDGASIPKIFWSIIYPFGPYFPAALLHDYLYSKKSDGRFIVDREHADLLFLEAMFNIGVPWKTRHLIHYSVRIFGSKHFKAN